MYSNRDFNRWRRHPWHGLHAHADEMPEDIVQVYIEMTPDDVVKYELDKASGFLMVDNGNHNAQVNQAIGCVAVKIKK